MEGAAHVLAGKPKVTAPVPPATEEELPPADRPVLAIVKPAGGEQPLLPEAA
jgi:hypothetical protein